MGGSLPPPHHLLRGLRGHIQIQHPCRLRQSQQPVLKVEQPVQKGVPLLRRQLGGLVDGVAGGIPVGDQQAAGLIKPAPILLIGGIAIHGVKRGRGVGIDIVGVAAKGAVQIQADQRRGRLLIAGKLQLAEGDAPPLQLLAQQRRLGGLSGTVRSLEYDESPLHTVLLLRTQCPMM